MRVTWKKVGDGSYRSACGRYSITRMPCGSRSVYFIGGLGARVVANTLAEAKRKVGETMTEAIPGKGKTIRCPVCGADVPNREADLLAHMDSHSAEKREAEERLLNQRLDDLFRGNPLFGG